VTNHKATTRQWSGIERFVRYGAYDSCIIELRDRVEALEASIVEALEASIAKGFHHIGETNKMVPDGSLVKRVAYAITGDSDGPINWKPEARAAILAAADWLDQQELHSAATRLRQEAQ
jgi:hypothetical protein